MPDVDATPQPVILQQREEPVGVKKWLYASLISAGALALAGIVIFAVYAYMTSTPNYMLNAAMTNFANSEGQAGSFGYEAATDGKTTKLTGDFLTFTDPADDRNSATSIALGTGAARVTANVRLFNDSNDVQFIGLGNIARLIQSTGQKSTLSKDALVRLGSLDGQWYSQTPNDLWQLKPITSQHTLQGTANSGLAETMAQLYAKHPFITVLQQLGDEQIDGINTMHLKLGIDRNKLGDYLRALKAAESTTLMLTDEDINHITTSNTWNQLTTEVWIARSDRTFRQMKFSLPSDNNTSTQTLTVTYHLEQVATQRQAVARPDSAQSFSTFVDQISDILGDDAKTRR